MTGTLKVTPEKLQSTASEFRGDGQRVRRMSQQISSLVSSLNNYWEGEAQRTYSNKLRQLDNDIEKIIRKIDEHVNDLFEMSRTYQSAERRNVSSASSLNSNLVN